MNAWELPLPKPRTARKARARAGKSPIRFQTMGTIDNTAPAAILENAKRLSLLRYTLTPAHALAGMTNQSLLPRLICLPGGQNRSSKRAFLFPDFLRSAALLVLSDSLARWETAGSVLAGFLKGGRGEKPTRIFSRGSLPMKGSKKSYQGSYF